MYFGRLLASAVVAAALIGAVVAPRAPERFAAGFAAVLTPDRPGFEATSCPTAGEIFTAPFADIADIVSVTPLGGVTARGEPLPAPYIRVNTRAGATAFERRATTVYLPARAELAAIERRILRDDAGAAVGQSWTAHFVACKDVAFQLGDLDAIDPDLVRRVGGIAAFSEIEGPDHTGVARRIRLKAGAAIGSADGFDVALEDARATAEDLVRPERYRTNPYAEARALGADPALVRAIALDHTRARCPLAYMPPAMEAAWSELLGSEYGLKKAKGENPCRTAVVDAPGTAQGTWFTDAANNGVAAKVSAVALAPDSVDPHRLIFALHGRLRSLSPDMVALTPKQTAAREAAAKDFLTFEASALDAGAARAASAGADSDSVLSAYVNRPFAEAEAGALYCYEGLRANFVGPRINAVLLLQVAADAPNASANMKIEARGDAQSCADLPRPWAFTDGATTFYR